MFINKCLILFIGNDFIVGAAGERIDNYIKECTDYIVTIIISFMFEKPNIFNIDQTNGKAKHK